ncbi:MAG: hypothetical protein HN741_09200, partial [Anaerolineae bacterium]|nr:hypothetical protein [Anaerolineae bacterium]
MNKENFKENSYEDMSISRQTRNAFIAAVAVTIAAIINFFISLQISVNTKAFISIADTITVFLFVGAAIYSTITIQKGQKEKGIWVLLISIVLTLALRNALTTDLGILFGLFSAVLIPFIGLLTLKPQSFNRTLSLGLLSGSFYLGFDILVSRYLSPYRQLSVNVEVLGRSITILAIIVTLAFLVALYRQNRYLLLSSKITLGMVFFVLVPIFLLSITGAISLENSLGPRQDQEIRIKATFLADSINVFLEATKNAVNADSETLIFSDYLLALTGPRDIEYSKLEKKTFDSLRSIRRKDIEQI